MPRTTAETMLWLHSYGPFTIPEKESWVIIGSGPSATKEAILNIPKSSGIISLNGVIGSIPRSDVHIISHYEDFLAAFPFFRKAKTLFLANPFHVGYRCLPVTPFEMLDINYWSDHSDMDVRFFEKDISLASSGKRPHSLYVESTIATAALHLLARNNVEEVRTLGIDGGTSNSELFSDVFYYSGALGNQYDKGFREFNKTADILNISIQNKELVDA